MASGRMNQENVIAVRVPPQAAWAPGHHFVPLSFLLFFRIPGRVGRPSLDQHQRCSVTREHAYSPEWRAQFDFAQSHGVAADKDVLYVAKDLTRRRRAAAWSRRLNCLPGGGLPGFFRPTSIIPCPPEGGINPRELKPGSAESRDATGGKRDSSTRIPK